MWRVEFRFQQPLLYYADKLSFSLPHNKASCRLSQRSPHPRGPLPPPNAGWSGQMPSLLPSPLCTWRHLPWAGWQAGIASAGRGRCCPDHRSCPAERFAPPGWMTCSTVMLSLGSFSGRGCCCPTSRCVRLRAAGCRFRRRAKPCSSTAPLTSVVSRAAALPMRFWATRWWVACPSRLTGVHQRLPHLGADPVPADHGCHMPICRCPGTASSGLVMVGAGTFPARCSNGARARLSFQSSWRKKAPSVRKRSRSGVIQLWMLLSLADRTLTPTVPFPRLCG
jgi:hypothetical protein